MRLLPVDSFVPSMRVCDILAACQSRSELQQGCFHLAAVLDPVNVVSVLPFPKAVARLGGFTSWKG
jgi:hypothetical protein